eukprot:5681473-Pyramimonas_sp.AAC.1
MDPWFFHTQELGSVQHRKRTHDTLPHPKRDPIGSVDVFIFLVQEETIFGQGMYCDCDYYNYDYDYDYF